MKITKFEQSGFILENENGFKLAIDIGNKTEIEKLENISVDAFLVSHIHGDHFSPQNINALTPETLFMPKACFDITTIPTSKFSFTRKSLFLFHPFEITLCDTFLYESNNFKLSVFSAHHGPNNPTPEIENFGFVISMNEKTFYFAGDMFYKSGISLDDSNFSFGYVAIPIGGFYTFDAVAAMDFLLSFENRNFEVIPMHFENNLEQKEIFEKLCLENDFKIFN